MALISRKDARILGLKFYTCDDPCENGHFAARYVSSGSCVVCSEIKQKDRRKNNREKLLAKSRKRYQENKERLKAESQKYREENREKTREYAKKYRAENPETTKQKRKEYYDSIKDTLEFKNKNKENCSAYRAKNREKFRTYKHNRRARMKNVEGSHNGQDILNILQSQNFKCEGCEVDLDRNYHVDHVMPIYLGGSNWPGNLQILCPSCNTSKGRKHPCDWLPPKYRKKDGP